jgi:hypothetical protein
MKKVILLILMLAGAAYMGISQEKYLSYHTGEVADTLGCYTDGVYVYLDMHTTDENEYECQGLSVSIKDIDIYCEFIDYLKYEFVTMLVDAEDNEICEFMSEIEHQYTKAHVYFYIGEMRTALTALHAEIRVVNGATMIIVYSPGVVDDKNRNVRHDGVLSVFTSVEGFDTLLDALDITNIKYKSELKDSF